MLTVGSGLGSHTDLKRMRQGKVGGQFWSIFIAVKILTGQRS